VSVELISWALNLAPVPADRGGQPSTACKFVLIGLPTAPGRTARPRSLGGHVGLLHGPVGADGPHLPGSAGGRGIIARCDPDIVAAGSSGPIAAHRAGT
jgi:hypothetical protein